MSDMITRGKALYWGTSEWSADEIRAAYEIAERHHLHKPVMEQPQYNLFHRKRVEQEYKRLYEDIGLGLTTWSPLASGLLTGKYRGGVPADSRAQLQGYDWLRKQLTDTGKNNVVGELGEVADELSCTVGQLAIAWILKNPHVSTVITGASRVEQIGENMKSADVAERITPEIKQRIEEIVGDAYD
jgi:aryl-alcohol dehydrogenase-like predicted oxidoreductase